MTLAAAATVVMMMMMGIKKRSLGHVKKGGGGQTFSHQGARCKLDAPQLKQFSYLTHKKQKTLKCR